MVLEKISIIMPVHNTEKYVGETIRSILAQSYKNWELIAVNDGSTDGSLGVMESFRDDRITVVNNPEPGLIRALRLGDSLSTGDLITRMDSDDKMPWDKLHVMQHEWMQHGMGTVVVGGAEYFMDEGNVGEGFTKYAAWLTRVAKENAFKENIYRESIIGSNCSLIHRNDFNSIGGYKPDVYPEDYDLCFRMYYGGLKIVGLDSIVHHWRDREDRISRNWDEYKDNRFLSLKTHYFNLCERDEKRPLVIWGAGRNGKDIVRLFQEKGETNMRWVCDNEKKIGKDIYGLRMRKFEDLKEFDNPQIIVGVAAPSDQVEIGRYLKSLGKVEGVDYWFFS
jgi:glycosyltransferase involved in cell wall biosynthesis